MNFVRTGFRTVRADPALIFAEIAWRWAFGAFAWLLVIFTLRTIMEGVDVSSVELTLARTNDTYLIADAIARIIVQVFPRFVAAMFLVVPLLAIAWVVAATIGRAVTLDSLLRWQTASTRKQSQTVILSEAERSARDTEPRRRIYGFRVLALNCLRAIFFLATMLAFFGTVFLVSAQVKPTTAEGAPVYVLAWLLLAFVVGCFWGLVNWFLALAPIFIVRDGLGPWKAIFASIGLYRDQKRDYLSIGSWFGFLRGAALLVAIVAGLSIVVTSLRAGIIVSAVIALVYFAIADWLYLARLAAYVSLADTGVAEVTLPAPIQPEPAPERLMAPAQRDSQTEPHSGLS